MNPPRKLEPRFNCGFLEERFGKFMFLLSSGFFSNDWGDNYFNCTRFSSQICGSEKECPKKMLTILSLNFIIDDLLVFYLLRMILLDGNIVNQILFGDWKRPLKKIKNT